MTQEVIRIAGISDTHFGASADRHPKNGKLSYNQFRSHVRSMSENADVIVHCGDWTDRGDENSLKIAADIFSESKIPVVGVLGNHDIQESYDQARTILTEQGGIKILTGDIAKFPYLDDSLEITGIPGFAKRPGHKRIPYLPLTREEYNEMVDNHTQRLRKSLGRMKRGKGIVLVHFDQLRGTDDDTPTLSEIAQLVDSKADKVGLLLHGHDHSFIDHPRTTPSNIPIIDLAVPVHIRMTPNTPYRLINLPIAA